MKNSSNDYLHIGISDNRFAIHQRAREAYTKYASPYIRGRLIDIGCGSKSMEPFFAGRVTQHIGLDHAGSPHGHARVDIIASAYETEQPSDSFDTVLCTAVLEHLEEPESALIEAFRILRPGGYAIYSVPLFWHLHEEPRDFYRYTRYGLQYLFEKVGIDIVVIHPCGGFWVTSGAMLNYYLSSIAKGPFRYVVSPLKMMNNLVSLGLERLHKAEQFTWMYLVVAQKQDGTR